MIRPLFFVDTAIDRELGVTCHFSPMSAYANLPGSFLPFFAFGAGTSSTSETSENDEGYSPKTGGRGDSLKALSLSTGKTVGPGCAPPSPSPSTPSDIVIAVRSARVDPVALLKSLASPGRSARRTTSVIVGTPAVQGEGGCGLVEDAGAARDGSSAGSGEISGGSDESDSDSCDWYDYSDDFSGPGDNDDDDETPRPVGASDEDSSAIEFEMAITFQGRQYNAIRTFPAFVKLRNDLLREYGNPFHRQVRRRCAPGPQKRIAAPHVALTNGEEGGKDGAGTTVPEFPRLSPESLRHDAGRALAGAASGGFALLQATAQHYCPAMELWLRRVSQTFPCSQSLSSFLWEPLSVSSGGWDGDGERCESDSGGFQDESISPLRGKPWVNASAKARFYMRGDGSIGSNSSLSSIDEGKGYDSDDQST